jgi:Protein of unknown function (DUF5672)
MIVELKDVTLCAADCAQPVLAARALTQSMQECEFGDAVLFSDAPTRGPFRSVKIPTLGSRADYSQFMLKRLADHVSTSFVLIVQWDGYVLTSGAWRAEFVNYDYVGAVWPWHTDGMSVGNGGFSLRSRRLLDIAARSEFSLQGDRNEDETICRKHRLRLEQQHGVQFAPVRVAERFSYERGDPEVPTFGFHGLFNMWRHVGDQIMMEIADSMSPGVVRSREFIELLFQYVALRKFAPASALFAKLQASLSQPVILELASQSLGDATLADRFIRQCERMTAVA